MQIKYIGKNQEDYLIKNNDMDLTPGKLYTVIEEDEHDFRIVDDSGEDYLYPKSFFSVVEDKTK